MTTIKDLRAWLDKLGPESTVAAVRGLSGFILVELDKDRNETGENWFIRNKPSDGAEITREEFEAGGH